MFYDGSLSCLIYTSILIKGSRLHWSDFKFLGIKTCDASSGIWHSTALEALKYFIKSKKFLFLLSKP